jgi:hypothetical protein
MRSKLLEGASLVCVYIVDNNTFINHLPMQKVTLRPDPVFMLASAHWAVSGDSKLLCVARSHALANWQVNSLKCPHLSKLTNTRLGVG